MSAYLQTLYADLAGILLDALPDLANAGGVRSAAHVSRVPWESLPARSGVVHIPAFARASVGGWGADTAYYEVVAHLYVLRDDDWTGMNLLADLEAVRDRAEVTGLQYGQVLRVEELSTDDDLPANGFLSAQEGCAVRAGRVMVRCLVGEAIPPPVLAP